MKKLNFQDDNDQEFHQWYSLAGWYTVCWGTGALGETHFSQQELEKWIIDGNPTAQGEKA